MIRRKIAAMLAGVLACTMLFTVPVMADSDDRPYVALGADLTSEQRATVLGLLDVTEKELEGYRVDSVSNKEEHDYLDAYLSASVIGTKALSSVKVVSQKDGYGIKVKTQNISYCTTGMYQNSLATAGVKNADVVVAGPFNISGTAALVGTIKAYGTMTGEVLKPDNVEAATNELVVTSQLGETIGDKEKAAELIGAVKDIVVSEKLDDPAKIEATIDETAEKLNISITEQDKAQIASLMEKISGLDLDVNALKEQAKELYNKLGDLGITEATADGFFAGLGEWFSDTWASIKGYFADLF